MSAKESEATHRRRFPVRAVLIVMLIAALVVFGALNADPVPVKPFGHAPLYQVLLIPFFVGLIVGWALRSRIVFRIRTKHSSKASQTETQ